MTHMMENRENGGLRKGSWTEEEDALLRKCIEKHGEGKWHLVPLRAGLNRCRKSCRLRWLNYLRPNIKRGQFAPDEVDLISRMHKLLGNRWALIAGRLPGRTANDIKNFWNTHLNKKAVLEHGGDTNESDGGDKATTKSPNKKLSVIKPQPLTFSKNSSWIKRRRASYKSSHTTTNYGKPSSGEKAAEMLTTKSPPEFFHGEEPAGSSCWWESILFGQDEMLEQEIAADKYSNCHMTTLLESKEDEQNTDLWVSAENIVEDVESSDLDHHLFSDENLWASFGVPT